MDEPEIEQNGSRAGIAFHLVVALASELAISDPKRAELIATTLENVAKQYTGQDQVDAMFAAKTMRDFIGTRPKAGMPDWLQR